MWGCIELNSAYSSRWGGVGYGGHGGIAKRNIRIGCFSAPPPTPPRPPPPPYQVVLHRGAGQQQHVLPLDAAHALADQSVLVLHLVTLIQDQVPAGGGGGGGRGGAGYLDTIPGTMCQHPHY